MKPSQKAKRQQQDGPKRPAEPTPPNGYIAGTCNVPRPHAECNAPSDVEVVRHRACDPALLLMRAEDSAPNRNDDCAIEGETALPKHERCQQQEPPYHRHHR